MKRLIYVLIIILEIVFCYVMIRFDIPCLIKLITKIPCPACGLTRAFISLFNFKIIDAIKYNFLCIPLFIFLVLVNYYLIKDIILNKYYTKNYIYKIFKHYKIIIILLIISEIINLFVEI